MGFGAIATTLAKVAVVGAATGYATSQLLDYDTPDTSIQDTTEGEDTAAKAERLKSVRRGLFGTSGGELGEEVDPSQIIGRKTLFGN